MEYHPVVQKIKSLLEENNIQYKFFEHEAVRTSEEAQKLRPEYNMSQGAKALILRVKKKNGLPAQAGERSFAQCVIPADLKLDGNKVKALLSAKSISFATAEESAELTNGIEFGGIPPFGNLFGIPVYVDRKIRQNEEIIFNCGDRRASISMRLEDYLNIVQPIETDITV